jgi:hypothetical protein
MRYLIIVAATLAAILAVGCSGGCLGTPFTDADCSSGGSGNVRGPILGDPCDTDVDCPEDAFCNDEFVCSEDEADGRWDHHKHNNGQNGHDDDTP